MSAYFSREHFIALQSCANERHDPGNPQHQQARPLLKDAYEVTASWAQALQRQCFPEGYVKVRRAPLNQAQAFHAYNWARIYPATDAPVTLAYTVGIDSELGFIVKIDTVFPDAALQRRFEQIAGDDHARSPVAATLSMEQGLAKNFDQLLAWSVEAVRTFTPDYPTLVKALGLFRAPSDDEVLARFDKRPEFAAFRRRYWRDTDGALFCRLARAVHLAGFDWWHGNKAGQLRFGRKQPGAARALGLLGVLRGQDALRLSCTKAIGEMARFIRASFDEARVVALEEALEARSEEHRSLLWPVERDGYWPDQLQIDDASQDARNEKEEEEGNDVTPAKPMTPINRIYYGPPGTGKTWTLLKLLQSQYEDGADAVDAGEWRKQVIAEHNTSLTWWEVVAWTLYASGDATVASICQHEIICAYKQFKRNKRINSFLSGMLDWHSVASTPATSTRRRHAPFIFEKKPDGKWSLAAGWEAACADLLAVVELADQAPSDHEKVRRYSMVTFHQSYGYEEFVEGLRPVLDDGDAESIGYEIRPGVFKELCRRARETPDKRFAMVIDEINRGNISKIFGELITLIEADKREGADFQVSVTLPYSQQPFSIPANVDIIGSMNTADRSLALLDTALRRRFEFVAVMPDARDEAGAPLAGLRVNAQGREINVPKLLEVINQRIRVLYDEDHCIGHGYFEALKHMPDGESRLSGLASIFRQRIVPLLEEYFFEDRHKVRMVLGDPRKPEPQCFFIETPGSDWATLFGAEAEQDSYSHGRFYQLQPEAFLDPLTYIATYQR